MDIKIKTIARALEWANIALKPFHKAPETPDALDTLDAPEAAENFDAPQEQEAPKDQGDPEAPEAPEAPETKPIIISARQVHDCVCLISRASVVYSMLLRAVVQQYNALGDALIWNYTDANALTEYGLVVRVFTS